jgi:hypothetical protein
MSHTLNMTVYNNSQHTLTKCSVTHDWDGVVNSIDCNGLNPKESSPIQTITSGYTQYDWYNVDVRYANGKTLVTRFYCNSSYAQDAVQIRIDDGEVCDCIYFEGGKDTTGCYDKG